MHGYMSKMGNPFLTQWQRRYFYLFPNRLEWRGEGEAPVRSSRGPGTPGGGRASQGVGGQSQALTARSRPAAEPADHGGDPVGGGDADQGAKVPPPQDPRWQAVCPAVRCEWGLGVGPGQVQNGWVGVGWGGARVWLGRGQTGRLRLTTGCARRVTQSWCSGRRSFETPTARPSS